MQEQSISRRLGGNFQAHISKEKKNIEEKKVLLEAQKKELIKAKIQVSNLFDLYHEGQIPKEGFKEQYDPLFEQQQQIEKSIMELQEYIDLNSIQSLGNSQVLSDAQNLFTLWDIFTLEEKKIIIETITETIIAGKEDIEIKLSYIPTLVQNDSAQVHTSNLKINNPYYSKTVQISDKPSWIH